MNATKTTRTFYVTGSKGQIIAAFKVKITNKAKEAAKKITKIETVTLRRSKATVLAKTTKAYGCNAVTYCNRTQAQRSVEKLAYAGIVAEVIQPGWGSVFYVAIN